MLPFLPLLAALTGAARLCSLLPLPEEIAFKIAVSRLRLTFPVLNLSTTSIRS
jgi:hypothetical protein